MSTMNIRSLFLITWCLLAVASSVKAANLHGPPDLFDKMARTDLKELADEKTPAFVSECLTQWGKATLVLPLGYKNGFLIAWDKEHKAANYLGWELEKGEFINWNLGNGGPGVLNSLINLVEELKTYPFQFLPPDQLPRLRLSKPQRVCVVE